MGNFSASSIPKNRIADILAILGLMVSFWLYHDYRSPSTGINQLLNGISYNPHYFFKPLQLPSWIVYNLPEGLWVLAVTLWSRNTKLKFYTFKLNAWWLPLLFAIALELLQFFHITDGFFDWMDVAISTVFWLLGVLLTLGMSEEVNSSASFWKYSLITGSYLIVFLSDIFY